MRGEDGLTIAMCCGGCSARGRFIDLLLMEIPHRCMLWRRLCDVGRLTRTIRFDSTSRYGSLKSADERQTQDHSCCLR